jgi:AAA+ superfamily predicted ATPase
MTETPREKTQLKEEITGIVLVACSGLLAYVGTRHGARVASEQLPEPIAGEGLWPLLGIGTALLTVAGMAAILTVILGVLGNIATPQLFGRRGYTLAGVSGLVGTTGAVLVEIFARLSSTQTAGTTGITALALVSIPLGGVFYWLWNPSSELLRRHSETEQPAPESAEEGRIQWSTDVEPGTPPTPTPSDQLRENPNNPDSTPMPDEQTQNSAVNLDELEYDWRTETDVMMSDIGGMDELKKELNTDVIQPLTTGKEKANALDIPLPNIVFHGPPGTGKTFTAKALATELGLPFAKLSGADVQSKWINESAQKINTLFDEAQTVAEAEGGAVVFLDELDTVLKQRDGAGQSHEEDNKVVAEFLNHLQETSEHDILFVGATNRLDALDDAGIRAGRIDKKIHVGKPDQDARRAILRSQLTDRPNDLTDKQLAEVAERTNGLVAADLETLVVDAARASAFEREGEMIRWGDLSDALERRGVR